MMQKAKNYAILVVGLHVLVEIVHGIAHVEANVWLTPAELAFVIAVIAIAPVVSLLILNTRAGALLLGLSMLGALLFGVYNHFIANGADNAAHVLGAWHLPFEITGYLLVILEAAGVLAGVWCLYETMRRSTLQQNTPLP